MTAHKDLIDPDVHEPKGIADATSGQSYVADGNGSGAWTSTTSEFAIGTRVLFQQTAAPTGWTKITTYNDKALRVVSGAVVNGGVTGFTTVFGSGKTTGSYALVLADLPSVNLSSGGLSISGLGGRNAVKGNGSGPAFADISEGTAGTHLDVAKNCVSWTPDISGSVPLGGSDTAHSHTLSLDLAYVDVIIAAKA